MQANLAVVSLKNIRYNAAQISRQTEGAPLFAVVKDDAYGHGMVEVAHALSDSASLFCVATVEEGVTLRTAGISQDILVFTPPMCEFEVLRGTAYGLIFTLSSLATYRLLARVANEFSLYPRVHVAVNTGMNRVGLRPERVKSVCEEGVKSRLIFEGIYSHFYAPQSKESSDAQFEKFLFACQEASKVFPKLTRHIAATGGALADTRYVLDGVRAGIGLYGYLPTGFEDALPLKPAMRLYTHVVQSGKFTGGGVGYAPAEKEYGRLKTLRLGYGDGLFRVGIEGGIGKLCMDTHIREGDSRLGRRELVIKDAAAYARSRNTISYEVLCRMGTKAVKIYER